MGVSMNKPHFFPSGSSVCLHSYQDWLGCLCQLIDFQEELINKAKQSPRFAGQLPAALCAFCFDWHAGDGVAVGLHDPTALVQP